VSSLKKFVAFLFFLFAVQGANGQNNRAPAHTRDTLAPKTDTLKPVIVTAKLRPRMKGDTLEYNTEHVLLRPNAVVEELLRQLPGLQIDAQGNITYNGEKIEHLLVDGQDIFGSDPTMVTRNFDAGKVARVQILDRKGDQAIFTGIDDGVRTKTLNLVIKESAKDGYFGKMEAAGDENKYYNGNAVLAAFKGKQQFTALGLASNTGATGFSSTAGGETSSLSFLNWNQDALGASAGTGVPRFVSAALHYGDVGRRPEDIFGLNYQYSNLFTQPVTTSDTRQLEPDSVYDQFQQSQSINQQYQQWVYGTYEFAPSRLSALKINFYGIRIQAANQFSANGMDSFNDTLVNSSVRAIHDQLTRENIGTDLFWRMQAGSNPERVFSVNGGFQRGSDENNGYVYSLNRFYQPNGSIQSMDTTDQRKQISDAPAKANFALNFAEPVWAGNVLGISGGFSIADDRPVQNTFDRGDGKYQAIVDSLSSQLNTKTIQPFTMITLQGKIQRLSYMLGNSLYGFSYHQDNLLTDSSLNMRYFNWAPRALLSFHLNPTSGFSFYYNTSVEEPTADQLHPVTNNSDPLHIILGNPDLHAGSSQNFRLNLYRFKTWIVNLGMTGSLIGNSISTRTLTDSLGRQISQPLNVSGGGTAGLNFSVSRKVFGVDLGLHGQDSYTRSVNYVNADLSHNTTNTVGGGFSLNKYDASKYALQVNTNFVFLGQSSSIDPAAPVHYWSQNHRGSVTLFFIRNFEVNTNAVYTWQQKTSAFTGNTSVLLWNAYVSHNFFNNRLVAKFQFNNILNANAGVTRTNALNTYTQSSTNILGRYWMLSAAWHFDHKFKHK
jgi:Outer membrane protein beta-barrel family